jgi:hypothetical protein
MHANSSLCRFLLALIFPLCAFAHDLSKQECAEGADYIRNAALSRDAGMSEADFITVFDQDLARLQLLPPSLRWFVQDEDDALMLRNALTEVFKQPQPPARHWKKFAVDCLVKANQWPVELKNQI